MAQTLKLAVSEENVERLNGLVTHIYNNIIIETWKSVGYSSFLHFAI